MYKKYFFLWLLSPAIVHAEAPIPKPISPPAGNTPVLVAHAKGDQIYQCSLTSGIYSWRAQAPDAVLFDGQGQPIGKHYLGPTWEYKGGGRVVGRILSKIDIAPDSSIPWLLIEATWHQGKGLLSGVNFINRINTHGGLPPLLECGPNRLGSELRTGYTADYVFYAKQS